MKAKLNPFIGKWIIVKLEAWNQEYVDMEVPGQLTPARQALSEFLETEEIHGQPHDYFPHINRL